MLTSAAWALHLALDRLAEHEARHGRVVHLVPAVGRQRTRCCRRDPLNVPDWDRWTSRANQVTCSR